MEKLAIFLRADVPEGLFFVSNNRDIELLTYEFALIHFTCEDNIKFQRKIKCQ